MSRAFRYLARELAKSYVLISIALLVLFDLLAFITESQDIGDAHYNLLDALLVVIYSTPALLVDLSPFIALLATLNAYDRLNATSELIALRAAGVSGYAPRVVVAGVACGVHDRPIAASRSPRARCASKRACCASTKRRQPATCCVGSGFWIRTGGTYVNVPALQDVRRPRRASASSASTMTPVWRVICAPRRPRWSTPNIMASRKRLAQSLHRDDGAPTAPEIYAEFDWKPTWDRTTRLYDLPIASFTIDELRTRVAQHAQRSVGAQADMSELWRRSTLPLAVVAYALLAVPFALLSNIRGGRSGRPRDRRSAGVPRLHRAAGRAERGYTCRPVHFRDFRRARHPSYSSSPLLLMRRLN